MKYVIYYHADDWDPRYRPFLASIHQDETDYRWLAEAYLYDTPPIIEMPDYDKVVTYEEALDLEQQWRLRLELEAL